MELEENYPCHSIGEYLEKDLILDEGKDGKDVEFYKVSDSLIDRWSDVFGKFFFSHMFGYFVCLLDLKYSVPFPFFSSSDIVSPTSKKCCCFTKSYGRFIKGTGSFITTKVICIYLYIIHYAYLYFIYDSLIYTLCSLTFSIF